MAAKKAATGSTKPKSTVKKSTPAAKKAPKAAAPAAPKTKKVAAKAAAPVVIAVPPTTDEISLRAFQIWEAKGKPAGMDDINWKEAEAQLKAERGL